MARTKTAVKQDETPQEKQESKEKTVKSKTVKPLTRAEKSRRQKDILRKLLSEREYKWNDLLEEATGRYTALHSDEEYDVADLKGKLGSSFSLMEEAGEVSFDKKTNLCALVKKEEKSTPKKRGRKKTDDAPVSATKETELEAKTEVKTEKAEKTDNKAEIKTEQPVEEKPAPKKRTTKKKAQTKTAESKAEEKEQPQEQPVEEKKAEKKAEEIKTLPQEQRNDRNEQNERNEQPKPEKVNSVFDMTEIFTQKKAEENSEAKKEVKAETPKEKKPVLTEFAFLGNAGAKAKEEQKPEENKQEKLTENPVQNPKIEHKNGQKKVETPIKTQKTEQTQTVKKQPTRTVKQKAVELSDDEKLKAEFLKKLRSLGGKYFEYYSVYLLERYSLKNGRRLEALKISGGETDGGIDGEIELTDKFGFKEVIYIQAKNWDPSKGDKDKWVVGETLLQQFVGAVTYRQAKEGKRKCRGIFVTTSRFTDGAKDILESLSADFIGYDGDDVFDAAKECSFGLIEKDGKWQLDEKLLSGEKAFFNMF